jgi:GTPase SAR1 family protein
MILVGTKCDEEENRKVKTEVAQKYVDDLFKECTFIETSAKTNHNVQEAFQVNQIAVCLYSVLPMWWWYSRFPE